MVAKPSFARRPAPTPARNGRDRVRHHRRRHPLHHERRHADRRVPGLFHPDRLGSNLTLQAIDVKRDGGQRRGDRRVRLAVATPTFAPPAGVYSNAPLVMIVCATPGAVIHYTTNGSPPTAARPPTRPRGRRHEHDHQGPRREERLDGQRRGRREVPHGLSVGRMKITFSGYNRAETLTNFPALVVLSESITNFVYGDFLAPGDADLRFTDATGTADLNYEIEKWDTGGNSYVGGGRG